jgi:hypothetical protein
VFGGDINSGSPFKTQNFTYASQLYSRLNRYRAHNSSSSTDVVAAWQRVVATGETVRANQAVARAELPGKVYPLNLANLLGVAPDEIHEYLIKKAGDPVRKDEVLAQNKPLIKWLKTEVLSPITGVVESVSTVTGQVLLREPPRVLELLGYVDGHIVEVIPQQGVVVETDCSLVQGIFGIGGETRGEIMIAVMSPDEALTPRHLTTDMKGKVIVGGSFASSDALARAK